MLLAVIGLIILGGVTVQGPGATGDTEAEPGAAVKQPASSRESSEAKLPSVCTATPTVAYAFMTRGALPLWSVWDAYFEGCEQGAAVPVVHSQGAVDDSELRRVPRIC